jgi:transposase
MIAVSDFQRCQIVVARLAGASVEGTSRMLAVSRGTVSKVMSSYEREGR